MGEVAPSPLILPLAGGETGTADPLGGSADDPAWRTQGQVSRPPAPADLSCDGMGEGRKACGPGDTKAGELLLP